jgi:hypothetical protein
MLLKRSTLLISGVITLIFFIINTSGLDKFCPASNEKCFIIINIFFTNFFWIIPVFVLTLIMYFMRREVFYTWLKFAWVWIILSMILVYIAPESDGNGMLHISSKAFALVSTNFLFFVISLIIIVVKWFSVGRKPSKI